MGQPEVSVKIPGSCSDMLIKHSEQEVKLAWEARANNDGKIGVR